MAKDKIHDAVKNALVKDGWTITAEPLTIKYQDIYVYADLAAEKPATDQGRTIVVIEVKSFLNPSPVDDLEKALGQYQIYRLFLEELMPAARVYLAIDQDTYREVFSLTGIQVIVRRFDVALLIVDTNAEAIDRWTK